VLGGPRGEDGELERTAELMREMQARPYPADVQPGESTTLVCVCTDAAIDKRGCGIVTRIAGAGTARAVDPAFTPFDGDVAFCLASGPATPASPGPEASWSLAILGTVAAAVAADAIRDAVRQAACA